MIYMHMYIILYKTLCAHVACIDHSITSLVHEHFNADVFQKMKSTAQFIIK